MNTTVQWGDSSDTSVEAEVKEKGNKSALEWHEL